MSNHHTDDALSPSNPKYCPQYDGAWAVTDGDGNYLTQGLQSPAVSDECYAVARSIATSRGESVWLGPRCACNECPSEIEVAPEVE